MINKLSLANFKAFGNAVDLDIKPITILCGANSSGKSSVMQSLLLLKQTFDSKKPDHKLMLNGRFVQLGSIEDIVNNHDKTKIINLSFENKVTRHNSKIEPIFFIMDILYDFFDHNIISNSEFFCSYNFDLSVGLKRKINSSISPIIVENLNFKIFINSIQESNTFLDVNVTLQKSSFYKVTVNASHAIKYLTNRIKGPFIDGVFTFTDKLTFINLVPKIDTFSQRARSVSKDNTITKNISEAYYLASRIFDAIHESVQDIFSSYRYLGPLRGAPSRRYIYEEEINEIGVKGENAAYIFQEEENKKIKDFYLYDNQTQKFVFHDSDVNLSSITRRVLNSMGIKNFSFTNVDNIVRLTLQSNNTEKTKVNIADVGFGVSQLFPIVLEGLRMNANDTLLLEQPEIHLHPNLQMQLADFLIGLALSKKNVIVETHSDHFINRLVRRVVEDVDNKLNDLIQIYFINPGPNGSELTTVELDAHSGISNWPKGFFDQNMSEQQRLLEAILAKELGSPFNNAHGNIYSE